VFFIIIYGNKNILKKMINKYNMKNISILLAIPIVLAASLVFGSLSFSVYGQESQTITPVGNQTTDQTAAPATTDNSTSPQTTSPPQTAPATAANQTSAQTAAPATAANQTSAQNNQTSSQGSSGGLKAENILKWSNLAVIASNEGNGTGITENLAKLQDYIKSSLGDKVVDLPADQIISSSFG